MSKLRRAILVLLFLAFLEVTCGLWIAERYNYPKENVIEVAKYGLERGGSYEIEVSFRQMVNVPSPLLQAFPVRRSLLFPNFSP